MLTEAELSIIGEAVGGTFDHYENNGNLLVFGSHTFPSHRITVYAAKAEQYIWEIVWGIVENSKAD